MVTADVTGSNEDLKPVAADKWNATTGTIAHAPHLSKRIEA